MTPYEIIILLAGFGAVVFLAAYNVGRLKGHLHSEREQRQRLEDRIEKLEAAQDAPIGYNQMQNYDEVIALAVGAIHRLEVLMEHAKAGKRGNWRAQKKD